MLLLGESGTGKELVAHAIHEASPRKNKPFVKLNCGALPETLLESELFGYEKGAFTGARHAQARAGSSWRTRARSSSTRLATCTLADAGEAPPGPAGARVRRASAGTSTLKVDVRFLAATHRESEPMVARGAFREDLFYRLNVVPIHLPAAPRAPGGHRPAGREIPAEHARGERQARCELGEDALQLLGRDAWPGNVRQLQNFIERLVVFADGETISAADVTRDAQRATPAATEPAIDEGTLDEHVEDAERRAVRDALARARGSRTLAARLLGVSRRTLYNKMARLGVT